METAFDYLRVFGPALAERILETDHPLQSTNDPVAPSLAALLRKALPACSGTRHHRDCKISPQAKAGFSAETKHRQVHTRSATCFF